MNCANHPDVAAVAYCRTCGKPLCGSCTRDVRGVIYCENCLAARIEGTAPGTTPPQTGYQQFMDQGLGMKVGPGPASGPNPVLAGLLAIFPGLGAVYCSQYAKGIAHFLIFVMLIYGVGHAGSLDVLFGLGIAFFYVYQIIDAVKTAHALQAGTPVPDPMGIGNMVSGGNDGWKANNRNIPTGAVVLIALGVLFLLNTMGVFEDAFARLWPLLLIALGAWMLVKHPGRRGLIGPIMVLTTGAIMFLSTMNIASVDRTWPAWILAAGVAQLMRGKPGDNAPVPPPPTVIPPSAPGEGTSSSTSSSSEVRNG